MLLRTLVVQQVEADKLQVPGTKACSAVHMSVIHHLSFLDVLNACSLPARAQCMQLTSTPTKVHVFHLLVIVQDILQDLLHFANPRRQPIEHGFAVFDHIQCFARHLSGQILMVRQPGG